MKTVSHKEEEESPEEKERQERIKAMPILEQCYNLMDFESVARRVMKKSAWAYYSSGADDEIVSWSGEGEGKENTQDTKKTLLVEKRLT